MAAYLSSRIAFQDLADRNPPDASGRTGVGRANFRIAMLEAEAGDRDAAAKSWSRAEADFEVAVRQPNPPIRTLRGLTAALAMEGKWTSTAAAGVKVVDASDRSCESLIELALLQWAAGDESGYRISCSELVSRFGGRKEDRRATDTIMACIAGEPAVSDTGPILSMAERAVAAEPDDPLRRVLLGVAMCARGTGATRIGNRRKLAAVMRRRGSGRRDLARKGTSDPPYGSHNPGPWIGRIWAETGPLTSDRIPARFSCTVRGGASAVRRGDTSVACGGNS